MSPAPLFPAERIALIARAISVRLRLSTMLRRRSLPDLLRALTPPDPSPSALPLPLTLDALAVAERLLSRVPTLPNTCLYRALARYAVLRRGGHPARFFMAIDPKSPDIEGHAWVALDGAPALEPVDPRLVVTYSYPSAA